jgi:uncharacterized protein YndB with AHSA1/START domain
MPAVARAEMLIRSPASAVFRAFVQPASLRKFWLKRASAPLSGGAVVSWEFLVPGATETVKVTRFIEDEAISFVWSDGKAVQMRFRPRGRSSSVVEVEVRGFKGRSAASEAVSTTEGFAIVLCDLKSFLEKGKSGGMVRDKATLIASALAKSRAGEP